MKRFAGLSLVPAPQFVARVSRSAFRFPIIGVLSLVAISTMHCTVHMSVAWWRGSMGAYNLSVSSERDGHSWSVGWSMHMVP